MRRPGLFVAIFALFAAVAHSAPAAAAELIMFETKGCPWCKLWDREVGPGYAKSDEGRIAPLRRHDLRNGMPADVRLNSPVTASPTFVLTDQGREVGRITGYPGADFFWGELSELIRKAGLRPPAREPSDRRAQRVQCYV